MLFVILVFYFVYKILVNKSAAPITAILFIVLLRGQLEYATRNLWNAAALRSNLFATWRNKLQVTTVVRVAEKPSSQFKAWFTCCGLNVFHYVFILWEILIIEYTVLKKPETLPFLLRLGVTRKSGRRLFQKEGKKYTDY